MDVQQTWEDLLTAWAEHDWQNVQQISQDILEWLERNGFAPEIVSVQRMGNDVNRVLATAACQYMAELARQVTENANGIPHGVPFSVSCFECDAGSPDSFEQALTEGWVSVEFFPQGVAENFLGLCPDHKEEQ